MLSAMVFDPYTNMLYVAVDATVFKIKVNYGGSAGFPPLPEGDLIITPEATHDLIASDSSAVFNFVVGTVDEPTRVSYQELPPTELPGSQRHVLANDSSGNYTLRQFELTAVVSDTNTALTSFNNAYQLKLYYSPKEIGPIIGGNNNVQLYQWDGTGWQQVGSTNGSSSENMLYIYTNLTGRFAVIGPTNNVYLPVIIQAVPST
jgi:hypothetical protein